MRTRIGFLLGDDMPVFERVRALAPDADLLGIDDASTLAAVAPGLDALVVGPLQYSDEVAAVIAGRAARLRWLQCASSGIETFVRRGVPAGVVMTNAASAWAPTVAEHAFALLLALARRIPGYERDRQARRWDRDAVRGGLRGLAGTTVAVVGFGAVGRAFAERARAFGMGVIAVTRSGAPVDGAARCVAIDRIDDALGAADAVVLCVPWTPSTDRLIDAGRFAAMRGHAVLVNVARGRVVDTGALLDALAASRLAGAALDVVDPEPLSPDHPLWRRDDVLITPHVAAWGGDGHRRLAEQVCENLRRFVAGAPLLGVVARPEPGS